MNRKEILEKLNQKIEQEKSLKQEIHNLKLESLRSLFIEKLQNEMKELEKVPIEEFQDYVGIKGIEFSEEQTIFIHYSLKTEKEKTFHPINKSIEAQPLPDFQHEILRIVGEKGISLRKPLYVEIRKKEKDIKENLSDQNISAKVKELVDNKYLTQELIKIGSRGGYNQKIFQLSNIGVMYYKTFFGKEPVESFYSQAERKRGGVTQTLFIEMLKDELEKKDFFVIQEENYFILKKNGENYPLLFNQDFLSKKEVYDLLTILYEAYSSIYLIGPNEERMFYNINEIVFAWIKDTFGSLENAKNNIGIFTSTFERVKNSRKTTPDSQLWNKLIW